MWQMLRVYGVGGKMLKAVQSFYVDSRACVRVGNDVSEWFPVNVGLRGPYRQVIRVSSFFFYCRLKIVMVWLGDPTAIIVTGKLTRCVTCKVYQSMHVPHLRLNIK